VDHVNIEGWKKKSRDVRASMMKSIADVLDKCEDDVFQRMIANLSGPHYKIGTRGPSTGKMPVPRMTGTLARASRRKRLSASERIIFSDPKVAHYAKYVHDGTRPRAGHPGMKPRHYLGDVIKQRRAAWLFTIRMAILNGIRLVGR